MSLLNSFLFLSYRGVNISGISIDGYLLSTVENTLSDAGIIENQIHILPRPSSKQTEAHYFELLYREHKRLFQMGKAEGCITTNLQVYERLAAEGIPVAYSGPTTDNVIRTVTRIKQECMQRLHLPDGNLAVLVLHITPKEEIAYQPQREYLESREKLKAAEELFYFAKDARAAVVQQSDELFTLLMNRDDLMTYSNSLASLPFLHLIQENSKCNVSLGIGFGYTPGEARSNAGLALKKAAFMDGSCTYIAHNINSITGPVAFAPPYGVQSAEEREKLQKLAELTGISTIKLRNVILMKEQAKKSTFTPSEVAKHLKVSLRTASRLLAALEENGLACLSDKAVSGRAGRPENIYRISFDLGWSPF